MSFLPIAAISGLAYILAKNYGARAVERLSIKPVGVPSLSWDGLKIQLEIFNPTFAKVLVKSINGSVFLNNKIIADYKKTGEFLMSPGANKIDIVITPNIGILELFKIKFKGQPIILKMNWNVGTSIYNITGSKDIVIK